MLSDKDFYYFPVRNGSTPSLVKYDLESSCPQGTDKPITFIFIPPYQKCCQAEACYCCFYTREPELASQCLTKILGAGALFLSYISLEIAQLVCSLRA